MDLCYCAHYDCQFGGLYFNVQPTIFKSLFELKSFPSVCLQIFREYLTTLFFLFCTVGYRSPFFLPRYFMIRAINPGQKKKTQKITYSTDINPWLVEGINPHESDLKTLIVFR